MDYDKGLVLAVLREGKPALKKVRESVPTLDYLTGDGKTAYDFLVTYTSTQGELPSLQLVQQHTGIDLDPDPIGKDTEVEAPAGWWADQIVERRLHMQMQETAKNITRFLEDKDPTAALYSAENALRGIRKENLARENKIETLGPLSQQVWQYYQDVKSGKRGILTPWPTVNDATLGFWPQDLAIFVARTGVGKTWATILIALEAWRNGHRTLFATTEISRVRIAMRFLAAAYKLPYNEFRRGKLDMFTEKRFQEALKEIMDDEQLFVAGGNFDFRVETFSASIDEIDPEFVILDGAYLLKVEGKNRTERAATAFDELKRLANVHEKPTVVTTQFNREVKQNIASSAKLESIGLTDVAGWNSDIVYALVQTDEMKKDREMIFKPLKTREGIGAEVKVQWDLDRMEFPELEVTNPNSGGGDADEFGTSVESLANKDDPGLKAPDDDDEVPF
jgi:replicative DNA helicase